MGAGAPRFDSRAGTARFSALTKEQARTQKPGRESQMSVIKRATVHYRKWDRGESTNSLSDLIQRALETKHGGVRLADDWTLRVTAALRDSNQKRLVNNVQPDRQGVFGCLCAYTESEMQAIIATHHQQAHTRNVPLQDMQAPSIGDFLHGIAYWLIIGDHCYIVQHSRVRTLAFEEYLTWLLCEKTDLIPAPVILQAAFEADELAGDLGDVKHIEVGGLVPGTPSTRLTEKEQALGARAFFSKSRAILDEVFGSVKAGQIMESLPEEADLKVVLQIFYKTRTRQVDYAPMSDLAIAFRNLDDGEIRLRGKDGTLHDDEARLHADMSFRRVHPNGSLLDLAETRATLMEVHRRFLFDGKIAVD